MVKARLNSILFQLLWSCAPVLVSVTSFLVFVFQGNELTVSIAFTVRLFACTIPILNFNRIRLVNCPIQHGPASSQYHPNVDCSNVAGKQESKSMFYAQRLGHLDESGS